MKIVIKGVVYEVVINVETDDYVATAIGALSPGYGETWQNAVQDFIRNNR